MKKSLSTYLIGSIEKSRDLGVGWRAELTPFLEKLGVHVYDPCFLEKEKLADFRPNAPMKPFKHWATGITVKPKHWHEAKSAPDDSPQMKRFLKYMRRIIEVDLKYVEKSSFVIVKWDMETRLGAGSLHEIIHAGYNDKPVYIVAESEIPAWSVPFILNKGKRFDDFDSLKEFLSKKYGVKK